MKDMCLRFMHDLGGLGLASAALLVAVAVFHVSVLGPLESREALLKERVSREAAPAGRAHPSTATEKVAAVYGRLQSRETATDWLARLDAIGAATGVELRSASYRTQPTEGRIVRYELVLPVAGSYAQIRDFLGRSLAEIPLLSIDQLALRREQMDDARLQGELRLTLHMVNT